MKILILGATGRVGQEVLTHALSDGHDVTVLVRDKNKLSIDHQSVRLIEGNVLNPNDIQKAAECNDIIVSALSTDGSTTLSEAMPLIIETMSQQGSKRIITIGTAGILQSRTDKNLLRYQSNESKRRTTRAAEEHHKVYTMLKNSELDWTIICPTYLPDGERIGQYRVERDYLPENAVKISVPDTADFVYDQISSDEFIQSRVGIGY
ncbi:hypothetical protein BU006_07300 [Mammaliicoccus sciuri]|uniref:NAD(P)-binding domain-containing protein n=1 Tax=Mammaliicoccus sciuri TaxID=1296 RepID=A0AAI8DKL9_MAMSC|nr:SDR family oxidoreductase [Mammaliicoccus sciuri]PCQ20246.1 hypothetical protein CP995_09935 [Klebsiella pneumoniae]ASE35559.1 hypothetical protein CEP64_13525 [Mammaliicoccus sciuri]MBV5105318.1 SDR family oxidoreductase [Mammaliicoccus sciuri]MCD8788945.1 SDR family oxidoreductase [Mammaliicoccus sciuri]MCD8897168.1 SDR family oxidoreductase [Mammaliicoccus sciuri]